MSSTTDDVATMTAAGLGLLRETPNRAYICLLLTLGREAYAPIDGPTYGEAGALTLPLSHRLQEAKAIAI